MSVYILDNIRTCPYIYHTYAWTFPDKDIHLLFTLIYMYQIKLSILPKILEIICILPKSLVDHI
jgi:hypothetical protein